MANHKVERAKDWIRRTRRDGHALWIAARDPRTPAGVKWAAGAVAAYALSPIDLIPDFVPILGHLDDAVLLPVGIGLVVKLVPADLMAEFRNEADAVGFTRKSKVGMCLVWLLRIGLAVLAWWLIFGRRR